VLLGWAQGLSGQHAQQHQELCPALVLLLLPSLLSLLEHLVASPAGDAHMVHVSLL
jgi:hypothetical protein